MARKTKSKSISIEDELLTRARAYAECRQRSFSWVVVQALREYLSKRKG